jgi:hypothetical protein
MDAAYRLLFGWGSLAYGGSRPARWLRTLLFFTWHYLPRYSLNLGNNPVESPAIGQLKGARFVGITEIYGVNQMRFKALYLSQSKVGIDLTGWINPLHRLDHFHSAFQRG